MVFPQVKGVCWIVEIYIFYKLLELLYKIKQSSDSLSSLENFYINNYFIDLKKRRQIIKAIISLYVTLILAILTYQSLNNKLNINNMLEINISFYIMISILALLVVSFLINTRISPILIIFPSTILGFFITLILIVIFLSMVTGALYVLKLFTQGDINQFDTSIFLYHLERVVSFREVLISFILLFQDVKYLYINILITVLIQVIIIASTPKYGIKRTKFAFIFVNYVFNSVILYLLYVSVDLSKAILGTPSHMDKYLLSQLLMETGAENIEKLPEKFKGLFDNFVNVSILPYVIGSFLGLIGLELQESHYQRKAKNYYINALSNCIEENQDAVVAALKKAVLFGGEIYELLIRSNVKFDNYIPQLVSAEGSEKAFWNKMCGWCKEIFKTVRNLTPKVFASVLDFILYIPDGIRNTLYSLAEFYERQSLKSATVWVIALFVFSIIDNFKGEIYIFQIRALFPMPILILVILNIFIFIFPIMLFFGFVAQLYYEYEKSNIRSLFYLIIHFLLVCMIIYGYSDTLYYNILNMFFNLR